MNSLFNLNDGDVVSIVGSGGKTTLMTRLSEEFSEKKLLVTTTTKIRVPKKESYDYIALEEPKIKELVSSENTGIYILGKRFNEEKLESLPLDLLESIVKDFHITLIEADGAKEKLIKGWNENEPVILNNTTVTVGVINLKILGQKVNSHNVHRVDEFIKLTEAKVGETIEIKHLMAVIKGRNGLFKNSKGKRILVINAGEKIDIGKAIKEEVINSCKNVHEVIINK